MFAGMLHLLAMLNSFYGIVKGRHLECVTFRLSPFFVLGYIFLFQFLFHFAECFAICFIGSIGRSQAVVYSYVDKGLFGYGFLCWLAVFIQIVFIIKMGGITFHTKAKVSRHHCTFTVVKVFKSRHNSFGVF